MGVLRHSRFLQIFKLFYKYYDGSLLEYEDSASMFAHPKTEQLERFLSRLLEWNVSIK